MQHLCPYCGEKNYLNNIVYTKLLSSPCSALIATECCRQPITMSVSVQFEEPIKTPTSRHTDDLGTPFNRKGLHGKYILIKYGYHYTTGCVHLVVKDNPDETWIHTESNMRFHRSSVLFSGTREQIDLIAQEHKDLVSDYERVTRELNNNLNIWLTKHEEFKYKEG